MLRCSCANITRFAFILPLPLTFEHECGVFVFFAGIVEGEDHGSDVNVRRAYMVVIHSGCHVIRLLVQGEVISVIKCGMSYFSRLKRIYPDI